MISMKAHLKTISKIFPLLLIMYSLVECSTSNLSDVFKYGSIPFGKTETEIFDMFDNVRFHRFSSSSDNLVIPTKWLPKDYPFDFSLEKNFIYLSRKLVQTFEAREVDNINELTLFFTKHNLEDSVYYLMAMMKVLKLPESSFSENASAKNIFDNLIDAFSKKIGQKPDTVFPNYTYVNEYYAYWETDSFRIFLQYFHNYKTTITYLSRKEWDIYYHLSTMDIGGKRRKAAEKAVKEF